jgi:dihydroorotate dehydrogenase electron transfer subunit
MKTAFIRVTECQRLYGETYIAWFDSPEVLRGATPGQFVMLRCADLIEPASDSGDTPYLPTGADLVSDPLLPRAMSYHRLRQGENGREFSILFDVVGRGTAWLAERQPGDRVFAWGPLGKGYSIRPDAGNLLLVGGGIGIAPLLWLADEAVAKGRSVVLITAARNGEGVFPADLIPPEVEVVVATDDGSQGRKGRATEPFAEYFDWADQVFACGPNPMFAAMAEVVRQQEADSAIRSRASTGSGRGKPVQVLLESPMGCGTGICYGCAVFDRKGDPRLVCKEGPRFDIRDIW